MPADTLADAADDRRPEDGGMRIVGYAPSMREDWNAFVDASPDAWFYHRREFIDMANRAMPMREFSVVAIADGRLAGILPLTSSPKENPPKLGSLGFGQAGMALSPDLGRKQATRIAEALHARALEIARRESCKAYFAMLPALAPTHLANTTGVSPLDPLGFANMSTSTYMLDLSQGPDAVFAGFRPVTRNTIRRAEKAGIRVGPAETPGDVDRYYEMHCETYGRTGVNPHPRAYFEGIFGEVVSAGLCRVYRADLDGRAIGFVNVAVHGEGALFWTGCSREEALKSGANHLLLWHAIQDAASHGVRHFEVGEAFPGHRDDKLAGLDTFKSGFGGERRPFHKGRIDIARPAPSRPRLAAYYFKQGLKTLVGKA